MSRSRRPAWSDPEGRAFTPAPSSLPGASGSGTLCPPHTLQTRGCPTQTRGLVTWANAGHRFLSLVHSRTHCRTQQGKSPPALKRFCPQESQAALRT